MEIIIKNLDLIFWIIKEVLEFIGVLLITFGSLSALYTYIIDLFYRKTNKLLAFYRLRVMIGNYIIAGLEMTIAADIVSTSINQTYYSLGILAFLVMLRAAISFLIERENASIPHEFKQKI